MKIECKLYSVSKGVSVWLPRGAKYYLSRKLILRALRKHRFVGYIFENKIDNSKRCLRYDTIYFTRFEYIIWTIVGRPELFKLFTEEV